MKETKEKHNANKSQRKFEVESIFTGKDPDQRTPAQWRMAMQKKWGKNWDKGGRLKKNETR